MSDEIAIKVDHVSKTFKLPHEKTSSIKSSLINFRKRKKGYEKQHVLDDISFEIKKGEFFGIVGRNGSGKSTLLKLLAGIYAPDSGEITINGKLTPFIELGVGFNPELSGRENVFLNGALLGFNRKEMLAMYDDIVEFAELERFMDQKLKNYSSGMQVRLAFSIAIRAQTAILLLDEVLAVGDALFQRKCFEYFKQLKKDGKTVVLVSHDATTLQEYCTSGILIEKGQIVKRGNIDQIVNKYIAILNKAEESEIERHKKDEGSIRHEGVGGVCVDSLVVCAGDQRVGRGLFTQEDDKIGFEISYTVDQDIEDPIYGLSIFDAAGQRIFAGNNMWSNKKMKNIKRGQIVKTFWVLPNVFASGTFNVEAAVATKGGSVMLDRVQDIAHFKVSKKQISNAYTNLDYSMTVE